MKLSIKIFTIFAVTMAMLSSCQPHEVDFIIGEVDQCHNEGDYQSNIIAGTYLWEITPNAPMTGTTSPTVSITFDSNVAQWNLKLTRTNVFGYVTVSTMVINNCQS